MSGKWGEISKTLKRCCVDKCCLQEVKWKGRRAKMIGNGFTFLWSGGCKLRGTMRVTKVNIVIGDIVWEVISCWGEEKFFISSMQ